MCRGNECQRARFTYHQIWPKNIKKWICQELTYVGFKCFKQHVNLLKNGFSLSMWLKCEYAGSFIYPLKRRKWQIFTKISHLFEILHMSATLTQFKSTIVRFLFLFPLYLSTVYFGSKMRSYLKIKKYAPMSRYFFVQNQR